MDYYLLLTLLHHAFVNSRALLDVSMQRVHNREHYPASSLRSGPHHARIREYELLCIMSLLGNFSSVFSSRFSSTETSTNINITLENSGTFT